MQPVAGNSYSSSGCASCVEEGEGLCSPAQDPMSADETLSLWRVELAGILHMGKAELIRTQVNSSQGKGPHYQDASLCQRHYS